MPRKPSITYLLVLATASAVLVGCGKVSLNLDNLTAPALPVVNLKPGAEFVASSQQGQATYRGYKVDTSAGASFGGLQSQTLNGYKVYSSMQGTLISENEEITTATREAAAAH